LVKEGGSRLRQGTRRRGAPYISRKKDAVPSPNPKIRKD
jgi:hypothetical protein